MILQQQQSKVHYQQDIIDRMLELEIKNMGILLEETILLLLGLLLLKELNTQVTHQQQQQKVRWQELCILTLELEI